MPGFIPSSAFPSHASSVTIEETTAPGPGQKPRKLVLIGSALPFMGADWGIENRIPTTWYPGNATEGTQHNLGPKELPTKWEGFWKRTLLGRSPAQYTDEAGVQSSIVSPHVLRDVLEDIARRGARLRVVWRVESTIFDGSTEQTRRTIDSSIIREGRIKNLRFPHDRITDIRWEAEFWWVSRGGRQEKAAAARDDADLSKVATALETSLNALEEEIDKRLKSVNKGIVLSADVFTLGQLESFAGAPMALVSGLATQLRRVVSDFRSLGGIATRIASQPYEVANAAVAFAANTVSVTNAFIDRMNRIPVELQSLKWKVRDLGRAANYNAGIISAAQLAAERAYQIQQKVMSVAQMQMIRGAFTVRETQTTRASDVIAVYITRQGDTPQRVSMRFYNSAARSEEILRANKLPLYTPEFTRGTVIIIPAMTGATKKL